MKIAKKEYEGNKYDNYFYATRRPYSRELEEIDITNVIRDLK